MTYTLTVQVGTGGALAVVVTDTLPSNISFGAFLSGPSGSVNATQIVWNLGDLPQGIVVMQFTVQVNSNVTNGIYLNNAVQVQGTGFGPNTAPTLSTLVAFPTNTPTPSDTPTPTDTPTWTPSYTWTFTPTNTASPTATLTPTPTPSFTSSWTPVPTSTFTRTSTSTPTPTSSFTPTWTWTPSWTPSYTGTPTLTPTSTWTPINLPCALQVSLPYPNPIFSGQVLHIDLKSGCTIQAHCMIFTSAYRKVFDQVLTVMGTQRLTWDLKDQKGSQLSNGVVYLKVVDGNGKVVVKGSPIVILR